MRHTRKAEIAGDQVMVSPLKRLNLNPRAFVRLVLAIETLLVAGSLLWAWIRAEMHLLPVFEGGVALLAIAGIVLTHRYFVRPDKMLLIGGFNQKKRVITQSVSIWTALLPTVLGLVYLAVGSEAVLCAAYGLVAAAVLSTLWRYAIGLMVPHLIKHGTLRLRVVVVGGGVEAEETLTRLNQMQDQGVKVLGLFDDREPPRSPAVQQGTRKLGRVSDFRVFFLHNAVDLVIVTMPQNAEARIIQILSELWELPLDIRLSSVRTKMAFRPRTYNWLGNIPMLDLFDRPLRATDAAVKRSFDLFAGTLILLVLAPLMVVIAVAVRLDSRGPVIFGQAREGYACRPFRIWKFRTLDHSRADPSAMMPVTVDDSRVTRLGRHLRRWSIDELPQLFNVIEGTMSLVGPRPHAVGQRNCEREFAAIVAGYGARHRVKPGITGLAQVRGLRGPITSPDEIRGRVELDLEYIDRWSVLLDLKILAMTLPALIWGENAV